MSELTETIAAVIRRDGPMSFEKYMSICLYDARHGFFSKEPPSGRDFVTSPEVGPLFGALVGADADVRWAALGSPDPFMFVEVGAGRGRLASAFLHSEPVCQKSLRYVLVEQSDMLRQQQREALPLEPPELVFPPIVEDDEGETPFSAPGNGPIVTSLAELPAEIRDGVIFTNELLDNLATKIVRKTESGWNELEVSLGIDDQLEFVENGIPSDDTAEIEESFGALSVGSVVPWPVGISDWLEQVGRITQNCHLVLVDYAMDLKEMQERQPMDWLRTYTAHQRGNDPFLSPGDTDITCDVPAPYLMWAAKRAGFEPVAILPQAFWLAQLGIAEFVEEGLHMWDNRQGPGDLRAIEGRSRSTEGTTLCDPAGLGSHQVFIFRK